MISIETLDLLLAIAEGELIEEVIVTLLAAPQISLLLKKFPKMRQALNRELPSWRTKLKERIHETPIPSALEQEFNLYQRCQLENIHQFQKNLSNIATTLNQLCSPFSQQASNLIASSDLANQPISESFQYLFLQQWRISLTLQTISLNHQLLEQEREQLIAELQERLTLSGSLEPIFSENETAAGRLWDMSKIKLQRKDYLTLVEYSQFLQQQSELQKLAAELGRSSKTEIITHPEKKQQQFQIVERVPANIPEEVSGLHQSDDILRLMPTELATLGIEELEFEFYRRFIEKRLLSYRLQGEALQKHTITRQITHQQQDKRPQGPFIICVDTSGSMGGFNEKCAKAFCLALLRIALADNRDCYIMLFADQVIEYQFTATDGLEQAIRFLSQRFRGGTDLNLCLNITLDKMVQKSWLDADAVIISDFIAQHLPEETITRVKQLQQQQQQRFHAVAISEYGKPGILHIFDYIWRFDTRLRSRILRQLKH